MIIFWPNIKVQIKPTSGDKSIGTLNWCAWPALIFRDMGSHVPREATKICNLCEVSSILTGSIDIVGESWWV